MYVLMARRLYGAIGYKPEFYCKATADTINVEDAEKFDTLEDVLACGWDFTINYVAVKLIPIE